MGVARDLAIENCVFYFKRRCCLSSRPERHAAHFYLSPSAAMDPEFVFSGCPEPSAFISVCVYLVVKFCEIVSDLNLVFHGGSVEYSGPGDGFSGKLGSRRRV